MLPDWRHFPDIVPGEGDIRTLIVNAAMICRSPDAAAELARVRNERAFAQLESRVQKEIYALLAQNSRREPLRVKRTAELTKLLGDKTETHALVRIKAALRAASLCCSDVLRRERRLPREPVAASAAECPDCRISR